ncbi:hypothetical protein [Rhodopirellula halodulae]|uniref:hypothetical protein n=1 Tax=Rhodopirellula halodulae TaxID=2894198 RepID=UPI001E43AC0D|nr:hypothetical protein [Rhodopirellula sp. JC737]MCC9658413.1 hypothetical protein [Rhodopirellula sp. JC737]
MSSETVLRRRSHRASNARVFANRSTSIGRNFPITQAVTVFGWSVMRTVQAFAGFLDRSDRKLTNVHAVVPHAERVPVIVSQTTSQSNPQPRNQ